MLAACRSRAERRLRLRPARPRRLHQALVSGLLLGASLLGSGWASSPRLRLERVEAADFASDGTITAYVSLVELEGQVDDSHAAQEFQLYLDGRSQGRAERAVPFATRGEPVDLVLVVETSALYGAARSAAEPPPAQAPPPTRSTRPERPRDRGHHGSRSRTKLKGKPKRERSASKTVRATAPSGTERSAPGEDPLDHVKAALHDLVEALGPKYRVLVIAYGSEVQAHPPFRPAPAATTVIDDLAIDDDSADLRLADALRAGLRELDRQRQSSAPCRRLIVTISDGINSQMDRRTFRTLGDAAAQARVPIHSIAFSPSDERGPLLNLGELSKRSFGTLRWARTQADLRAQIETLADELNRQYALTFRPKATTLERHTLTVRLGELTSNGYFYDPAGLGVPATRWWRSLRFWMLALGALGAVVLIGLGLRRALRAPATRRRGTSSGEVPAAASLVFTSGPRAGQRVPIHQAVLPIGSAPPGLILVGDPAVSARHARVDLKAGRWLLTDLGSTNGTFLNERRVEGTAQLFDGDVVRLGRTELRFRTG